MVQRLRSWCATALILMLMAACAMMGGDPIKVQVVGLEPLQGQGMELRFAAKLRVQNPNEAPIDYDGIAVELEVRGNSFASGVSDARGTIPRYGETVVTVPVTVSAFAMVRQAMGFASGDRSKIDYVLRGKVGGSTFGIHGDCTGCKARDPSLAGQLSDAGITWRAYMEAMPQPCFTGAQHGSYAKQSGTIEIGDSPTAITLPATRNFDAVTVRYGPA